MSISPNEMKLILTGTVMALAITSAGAAEPNQYLCLVESASGLHYDAQVKSWKPRAFDASGKYVLRRITDDDRRGVYQSAFEPFGDWAFFKFGDSFPTATCIDEASKYVPGTFFCQNGTIATRAVEFNRNSHRFEMVYRGGSLTQGFWEWIRREKPERFKQLLLGLQGRDPPHPDDLFFEVGKCSPF